ncbi:MAG: hypothetical protein R3F48_13730 [Candidatus Zixiibacteriota bacterium]
MVQPIALQDNLAKTQAVERMNQILKAQGEVGQQVVASSLKEKAAAEMERTKASEKLDMVIIRNDDEEKQKKEKEEKRKKQQDSDGNDSDNKPRHLDLRG